MDAFFSPRGVAVIGATANRRKGGYAVLFNLRKGYNGNIYPVNPRYGEIDALPCYRSVKDVPDPVDMAIVFVPSDRVRGVIADCAERGIGSVMIQSAGFAESGEAGRRLQNQILSIARAAGMRIWGPNCMGLVDAHRQFVFSFVSPVIWEEGLRAGPVSLVVQSGLLSAGFLIDFMTHGTAGISKACSIGNKSDVDESDILSYLLEDPRTQAIAMYLESIKDGRRFLTLCRNSAKPIVVLKGGRSRAGAAAALSHTASMAGDGALVGDVLSQAGVVQARDFGQMIDMARTLAFYPDIRFTHRPRVAVLTYSGAAGIVSADFIDELGLLLAQPDSRTTDGLKTLFPEWMPVSNPVDLWPAIEINGPEKVFSEALEALCTDPGVDLVLLHAFVGGKFADVDVSVLAKIARRAKKPLFCWVLGARDAVRSFTLEAQRLGVPVYREIGRSVECIASLNRALSIESRPTAAEQKPEGIIDEAGRRLLETGRGPLDEYQSKRLLAAAGIVTVEEAVATNRSEALTVAGKIGYPVVLKGLVSGVAHKTEKGLVELGIRSDEQLERACADIFARAANRCRLLIQRQVEGRIEIIVGLVRDRQFGPCVMCGFGGIFAEARADRAFAVAPLSKKEALALIDRLKYRHLLEGWRGEPAADKQALAEAIVATARLGCADERIQEIDVNPLIISAGRPIAVDATVVLSGQGAGSDR